MCLVRCSSGLGGERFGVARNRTLLLSYRDAFFVVGLENVPDFFSVGW